MERTDQNIKYLCIYSHFEDNCQGGVGLTTCQLVAGVNSGTEGLHRYETHTQYFYANFIVPLIFPIRVRMACMYMYTYDKDLMELKYPSRKLQPCISLFC